MQTEKDALSRGGISVRHFRIVFIKKPSAFQARTRRKIALEFSDFLCYEHLSKGEIEMLKKILMLTGALAIAACANGVKYEYPERVDDRYERPSEYKEEDRLFGADTLTFRTGGNKRNQSEKPVKNASVALKSTAAADKADEIWRSTLPVMSRYPVEMMQDGFITTEWFNDAETPYRQMKINAVRTSDGVQITVLCRRKNGKGDWVNQKNDATLAVQIKNDIVKLSSKH